VVTFALGCAAGGVAALPFARWARREMVVGRVAPLRARSRHGRRMPKAAAAIARAPRAIAGRRTARRTETALRSELPVVVDLVTVALGAGCTPFHALEHTARHAPVRSAPHLAAVVRAHALGQSFDDALQMLAREEPIMRSLAEVLRTSARLGSPATFVLDRLAADVRADVRRRAEARARTVPVRLCFPLVACVLPAFALLTVAPVVLGGLRP
jgi:Flp pilus assembly protein TadB